MLLDKSVVSTLSRNRTSREVTKRIDGVAEELSGAKFGTPAFFPYKKGDIVEGKRSPELSREIAALGKALTAKGFSRKNSDKEKSWDYVAIRGGETEVDGKKGYALYLARIEKPSVVARDSAKAKPAKAKKVRSRKAKPETETATPTDTATVTS